MSNDFEYEITDEELDRLVDGEVHGPQYRELLAALDRDAHGWRRCALAFLEAQALGDDLTIGRPQRVAVGPSGKVAATTSSRHGYGRLLVAIAASFVLAFALGALISPYFAFDSVAEQGSGASSIAPNRSEGATADSDSSKTDAWGHLTLVVDREDGTIQEVDLPVFRTDEVRDRWFEQARSVPNRVQQEFRRLGYEVRRDVYLEPIELEGGRRVFVPLGEMEFIPVPVSNVLFQ